MMDTSVSLNKTRISNAGFHNSELTHGSKFLLFKSKRALEEKNKELDGLRRQLAREEGEKHELFAQVVFYE